ncbi:hypothetical protein HanPI659440_Chr04g0140701 [Helianthus annuus]|nr:hypothetical protein HanPI659440_Chr04g0140701 [Helianthus annuus]
MRLSFPSCDYLLHYQDTTYLRLTRFVSRATSEKPFPHLTRPFFGLPHHRHIVARWVRLRFLLLNALLDLASSHSCIRRNSDHICYIRNILRDSCHVVCDTFYSLRDKTCLHYDHPGLYRNHDHLVTRFYHLCHHLYAHDHARNSVY